mmetsp:Transcript_29584/g.77600  ORF Transcript_29584/g.77600 Transcript_29584/m.77600 type:complete len:275 (+) Transcript_29584:2166-2990(+)
MPLVHNNARVLHLNSRHSGSVWLVNKPGEAVDCHHMDLDLGPMIQVQATARLAIKASLQGEALHLCIRTDAILDVALQLFHSVLDKSSAVAEQEERIGHSGGDGRKILVARRVDTLEEEVCRNLDAKNGLSTAARRLDEETLAVRASVEAGNDVVEEFCLTASQRLSTLCTSPEKPLDPTARQVLTHHVPSTLQSSELLQHVLFPRVVKYLVLINARGEKFVQETAYLIAERLGQSIVLWVDHSVACVLQVGDGCAEVVEAVEETEIVVHQEVV